MFKNYIDRFNQALANLVIADENFKEISLPDAYLSISTNLDLLKKRQNTVYLVGNGGSSGLVSHTSVDLLNSCKIKAFPVTDNSLLTCFANDFGYEQVFAKPLEILISEGDMLIAVSSSGNSKNIINAASLSKSRKNFTITFTGFKPDNHLRRIGDINFWIDSTNYGIVEIAHAFLLHYITDKYCRII